MEEVRLKPKVTLKRKGDVAEVATFSRMVVNVNWTLEVINNDTGELGPDFDLMAYYKCKDGREGGICSSAFNQNIADMGYLDKFPWMQLNKDAKADSNSKAGDQESEEMKIASLEEFETVYICVLNFEDAIEGIKACFGNYNGYVSVQTDSESGDNNFEVPLDSRDEGHIIVVCKIDNSSGKPRLINENRVLSLGQFAKEIPGSKLILE
jgi:hypothetical protein